MVLFQQPAPEIAGIGHRYAKTFKKVIKNDEVQFKNASGNFLFTSKEAVETVEKVPLPLILRVTINKINHGAI